MAEAVTSRQPCSRPPLVRRSVLGVGLTGLGVVFLGWGGLVALGVVGVDVGTHALLALLLGAEGAVAAVAAVVRLAQALLTRGDAGRARWLVAKSSLCAFGAAAAVYGLALNGWAVRPVALLVALGVLFLAAAATSSPLLRARVLEQVVGGDGRA